MVVTVWVATLPSDSMDQEVALDPGDPALELRACRIRRAWPARPIRPIGFVAGRGQGEERKLMELVPRLDQPGWKAGCSRCRSARCRLAPEHGKLEKGDNEAHADDAGPDPAVEVICDAQRRVDGDRARARGSRSPGRPGPGS